MKKLEMLYEGKAKKVYKTDDEKRYIIEYKDDATAFNGEKKGTIVGKGIINNKMSALLFKLLEEKGIPTHFVEILSDREMLVKDVKILPLEVIMRNVAAGSLSKRLGIEEGTILKTPVLEFCYKNDDLGDPMINEYHIRAIELATDEQLEKVKEYAFKINEILIDFFKERNIKLIDFKLEFGIHDGEVILADEISPDTCRLWDADTNRKLDKDRFRRDLGDVEKAYEEVLSRLQ
ncbi:phosphoribosylaminoimidazole-succinocarboxamide synthase [Caminicella sporogenes DSM 14501]|uniref:Phosphoribosylaminoimidazole-succinocarboxamide synthase n=1 Tax=Caminicella sporogenes DSM 14501 TaxID=1121266 RepID=A0A1M6RT81_9FIRM|nr:phosphoribosylaminoimidazolesuccinocarboxamide synthase [Caminicella sporogenes]RKD23654.1 phosphoribosylaminoimidazolesuccinocarboxamide synthase [Caminicella sporogenes]WIF93996.1 phosphoribosylaminoimidazolesuccinocarboxamide synthase [Caminicella sporogenes]SHK35640.1 phosphoribosylaminoimidazole-succinocarboxamide synthase [Caminicella sporogenes DSM 14501]